MENVVLKITDRLVDWVCEKIWPAVDPQTQFLTVQFDITNACNLACDHCYLPHHKNQGALTYEQWVRVLDQYEQLLKKLRMQPRVTLCGGEPLLCPFLPALLKEIRSRFGFCELSVQSNGTLVTSSIAELFKSLNVSVQISVDGPDAARHDNIRGPGAFAKTMAGCRILKSNDVTFFCQAVLSRRTVAWIPEFFKLALEAGATDMNFARLVTEGYAKTLLAAGQDRPLEGLELKNALQDILKYSRDTGIPTATHGALWHLIEEGLGSPNNVGFAGFVIGYRGEFKVTSRASMVLGNVLEEDMGNLFLKHPVMKKLRDGEIDVCGGCRYFDKCRGDRNASFAAFGNFFGPDPSCWLIPAEQLSKVE